MKFTIETTDISEAMAILANMDNKVEAPAQEVKVAEAKAEVKEEAHKEVVAPSHDDELANKRSEAATKKAKAKADKKAKEAEVDPLDDLGEIEDEQQDEAVDLEMVQSALRAAIKDNKENKMAVRGYFKEHEIVGGVDALPPELFNDCYKFAQSLV